MYFMVQVHYRIWMKYYCKVNGFMDVLFDFLYIKIYLYIIMNLIPETDKIDMAYLKSDRIGRVITRGLAEVYRV